MQTPMARSVCLARGAGPAENLRVVSGLQKSALPASYLAHPPGYEQSYVVPARTCCPQRPSGQPWWPSRCLPSSSARQCGGPLRLSPNLRSLSCHQCQTRGCRLPPCQRRACRRQSGRPCTAPRAWSRVTRQEVEPARRFSARWCPVELLFQGSKKGRLGGRVEEPSWAEEGDDAPSSSRAGTGRICSRGFVAMRARGHSSAAARAWSPLTAPTWHRVETSTSADRQAQNGDREAAR